MAAGRIIHWYRFQASLALSMAYTRSTATLGASCGGSLESYWCPNAVDINTGYLLSGQSQIIPSVPGSGSASLRAEIPALGISRVLPFASFQTSLSADILFKELRLYAFEGGFWRLYWDEIEFYLNGGLDYTASSGSLDGTFFTPAGIPLLGIPPWLIGSGSTLPAVPIGIPASSTTPGLRTATANCSASGGFKFMEESGGMWQTLGVDLAILARPTGACDCLPEERVTLTAPNTYGGVVTSSMDLRDEVLFVGQEECDECADGSITEDPVVVNLYERTVDQKGGSGQVMLMPALDAFVDRLTPDYAALITRGGFPKTTRQAHFTCGPFDDLEQTNIQIEDNPHPEQSSYLSVVRNASDPIEDTFSYSCIAPYAMGDTRTRGVSYGWTIEEPGSCPNTELGEPQPPPDPNDCFGSDATACYASRGSSFLPIVQHIEGADSNPYLLAYLAHLEDLPRYVNYWASRLWSFFYWFPPDLDEGTPPQDYEWRVNGDRANPLIYWLRIRQQWLSHPALPGGDNPQTRADLVSAPLLSSKLNGYWASATGLSHTSPWGICRYDVDRPLLSNLPLSSTSSPLWTFQDCTASFGANITLNPSATNIRADLDLGAIGSQGEMFAHVAKSFTVGWETANVERVVVKLVGFDGSTVTISDNVQGTVLRKFGDATQYAGSWAQEFGALLTSIVGVDLEPGGISSATLADVERVFAYLLLTGWTAKLLRFEIEVTDIGDDVELHYPTLVKPAEAPTIIQETGQTAAILWPNSSGIRWGQWSFWDYDTSTFQNPPQVFAIMAALSSLDWLCFKRVALEGVSATSSLDAELASLYDSTEGNTRQAIAENTNAFLLILDGEISAHLAHGLREVPAMSMFPTRGRDIDGQPTGEWHAGAYSAAQEPKYLINGGTAAAELYSNDSPREKWTTPASINVDGYTLRYHTHAVDNSELDDFFIVSRGRDFATASPWHGYLAALGRGAAGAAPNNLSNLNGEFWRVEIQDGDVFCYYSQHAVPLPDWTNIAQATDTADCTSQPSLAQDGRARLILIYCREDGNAYRRTSDDDGATWSAETLAISGATHATNATNVHGEYFEAGYVAGAIHGKFQGSGDESLSSVFTFKDEAGADMEFEDACFGLSFAYEGPGRWILTATLLGAGASSEFASSDDGRTWTQLN